MHTNEMIEEISRLKETNADLLAACKAVVQDHVILRTTWNIPDDMMGDQETMLRAVIAKAGGGA